jgi:hypothetical protein
MLKRSQRNAARNRQDETLQRTRQQMQPRTVRGGAPFRSGEANAPPLSTAWFDGTQTRALFLPGIGTPDGPYYVPAPQRPAGVSDTELLLSKKQQLERRIRQLR